MRVYRPTYTRNIPPDAKIFSRKKVKYARFKDRSGRQQEAPLNRAGDKIRLAVSRWHVAFQDSLGIKRKLKGFTDRAATQRLADHVQRLVDRKATCAPLGVDLQRFVEQLPSSIRRELIAFGLIDAHQSAIGRPLMGLLGEFEQSLKAQELSRKYVYESVSLTRAIIEDCSFEYFTDISPNAVERYLKDLREGPKQLSYRRSNAYLKAAKSFCAWLIKRGYAHESPLASLKELQVQLDRRHERRALTVEEVKRLLAATANGEENYGMGGYERYLLYRFVLETGLRAKEVRLLRKSSFDFGSHTVVVKAKTAKGKRHDLQHLSSGLSDDLKDFLATRLPDAKAFGGRYKALTDKTADMLRDDLKAAGIAYEDEAGRVFDFHALRGQCASLLAAAGVSPKTAQQIMRHRDVNMTMNTYTRVLRGGEAEALKKLPDLSLPNLEEQRARKTGTHDGTVTPEILSESCFSDDGRRPEATGRDQGALDDGSETAFPTRPKGLEPSTFGSIVRCSNSAYETLIFVQK